MSTGKSYYQKGKKVVLTRRTFSREGLGRGRPTKDAVSDQELWDAPSTSSEGAWSRRQSCENSFREFLFSCFDFPDLDQFIHGKLADFMGRPKGYTKSGEALYWPTREDLVNNNPRPAPCIGGDKPYGLDLDGDLLGLAVVEVGNGDSKLVLIPRNHLKSTIISVAYPLWRIAKNPAIRILISSAVAKDARKFLRAIKWHLLNNKKIEELWPEIHITEEMITSCKVTWTQNEITVPRIVQYEAGEATVEAMGVGGNLVSRHYDLIICDDLVNNKNSRTANLLEDTIDWFQNAHSLLDPVTGEVVVVGTRWDYSDLYAHLIAEHSSRYSLFFSTAIGVDGNVFFPSKFSVEKIAELRKSHGPYKFSCQYLNQPVDKEAQDFKASWLKYYEEYGECGTKDQMGRTYLPHSPGGWYTFAVLDPAITEDDGDESVIPVVSVNSNNEWYLREVLTAQYGNIDRIIDMMFEVQSRYPDIIRFGVETRGWQKTIASGAIERMRKKNVWIPIEELKGESNASKAARIMRLVPRFSSGSVYIPGKGPAQLEGGIKKFFDQYVRFPRGADDIMDAMAYIDMIAFPPVVNQEKEQEPRNIKEKLAQMRKRLMKTRMGNIDEHLGVIW